MSETTITHLSAAVLDAPVTGLNLRPGTAGAEARLRDQIAGEHATLLVFLRHFG